MKKNTTVQVNNISLSKIDYTIPQKRVLMAIIETISPYLRSIIDNNKNQDKALKVAKFKDGKYFEIEYKAADLYVNGHSSELRSALESLRKTGGQFTLYDKDGKDIGYFGSSLILNYSYNKYSETVELLLDKQIYNFLIDVSGSIGEKGYTILQAKVLLSLSSIYAVKIYELIAKWRNQTKFYISIEELKHLTNTISYKQTSDLKKRVLDIAKKQLDGSDITDLRFSYKEKKHGRKIIGFDIYPILTTNAHEFVKKENSYISARGELGVELRDWFTKRGVVLHKTSIDSIKHFANKMGSMDTIFMKLEEIDNRAKIKGLQRDETPNGKKKYGAYIMAAIK